MATPTPASGARVNRLGLAIQPYKGGKTTLCAGCGHNAISERIVDAFFEMGVDPKRVVKLSGIGCSSKSPAYFLNPSHGFNSVHGRMPSVATGAMLANQNLLAIGVSGDGDSGAIGIGQFVHSMRRNMPLIYIIEDNGCYGLTKGQFSATADKGSRSKRGAANDDEPIDLVMMALTLGASYVARGFSGDKDQLVPLIVGAVRHKGAALIDVVSPCVAFNNHPGSTKSYDYVRAHNEAVNRLDFMPERAPITTSQAPGETRDIVMHDGSTMRLKRLDAEYDPSDKVGAMAYLESHRARGVVVTGLLYVAENASDMHDALQTVDAPLNQLPDAELVPGSAALAGINASLR